MRSPSLAGTGSLVRLALRRDRILLPAWILALTVTAAGSAASLQSLYPTPAALRNLATGVAANPSLRALYGPVFDSGSTGGLLAWRLGAVGAVIVAVMSLLLVVRHTRAEEEAGRLELVGAGVVGRLAPLTAALVVALVANLALAVLVAVALTAVGLPASGSAAFGMAWASAGLVFAAAAAVAAQLSENARTANQMSTGLLGGAYLLRALGDTAATSGPSWLSWLSPIGWAVQIRPFAGERWWVLGLAGAVSAACAGAAYALSVRRDAGAGLLPARPGPAEAGAGLRSPLALAWRLQRGPLLAWTAGFSVLGTVFGSIAGGITGLVEGSPGTLELLTKLGRGSGLVDAFLATSMGMVGLLASVYAIQAALRLRGEETGSRAEPLLATGVTRIRWVVSHLTFALLGPAVLLAVAGLGAGLAHGVQNGDLGTELPRVLGSALVQLPAAWVLAGVTLALFGLAPRLASLSWAAVTTCLLLGQLGPVLDLSQWAMDLSPFTHLPKLPGAPLTMAPIAGVLGVAGALTIAGLAGVRHRDLGA